MSRDAVVVKAKLFRGLADSSRLRVVEALRTGPRCVSAVVEATGLSQPNVSGHLACLFDCGLVEREQRGRSVYYRVADPRVERLLSDADELLVRVGEEVYICTRYQEPRESSSDKEGTSLGIDARTRVLPGSS
ncbi:MAG: metalloregulator ArsR/SmtB family transcription factor [Chloroflexota bacterium]|nr:metalloregulator ArsR/SmtB family transcription factor [Chloroflexota bacterium]